MPQPIPWEIIIDVFGGFVPAYYSNTYPQYGNKEDASAMNDMDLTDPNTLRQGPGQAILTNGDALTGSVHTLMRGFLRSVVSDDLSYSIGGTYLYQLTNTSVVITGSKWPHVIDKDTTANGGTGVSEEGESVVHYKGDIYYFYNHVSPSAGDIGKFSSGSFDDVWNSNLSGSGNINNAPHQAINAGDDTVIFTNGRSLGRIDGANSAGNEVTRSALDFWEDAVTASVTWNYNRIMVAVNRPNVAGSNFNESGIFTWDGTATSWEGDPIEINGKIGALYTQNGVTYVWWQQAGLGNRYNFGFVSGGQLQRLRTLSGTLPLWYQVGEHKGFITWISDGEVYMFGADDENIPVKLFQYTSVPFSLDYTISSLAIAGGLATPFGELLLASTDNTGTFRITKSSGFSTRSSYKTRAFRMTRPGFKSIVRNIQLENESMIGGEIGDFTLTYNKGAETQSLVQMAYDTSTNTIQKLLTKSALLEDFRLDMDFSSSTTNNSFKVRSLLIKGEYVPHD